MKQELIHALDRTIVICAKRETVFRFFMESRLFADWWGDGSTIDGRVGGAIRVRFSNGILASGEIVEIQPPERIVFTYGFDSGDPISPGASLVSIVLLEHPDGTQLNLHHQFADASVRDEHQQGWRYQLALFANVASRVQHSDATSRMDAYFDLWNEKDSGKRLQKMNGLLTKEISFQDQYSCTLGQEDLSAHLSAYHKFMPGMILAREGEPQLCQGTGLVRWIATKKDGSTVAKGTNVFTFSPDGQIRRITGFWE